MVEEGGFRRDLYYRIAAFPIHLPPLRERLDDIPLLVDSFLRRSPGGALGRLGGLSIEPAALARLKRHPWPGNLRELRNVLERARLYADDGQVRAQHLPAGLGEAPWPASASAMPGAEVPPGVAARSPLPLAGMAALDDAQLQALAADWRGTRKALAQHLGLSERTLYRRLKG
jgi:transcriptional regulator of acetoin/glycerol metabolism